MSGEPTQTILQYNGVRLQNVQTLSFIETPLTTDGGQYICTKTELRILGYVTLDAHKAIGLQPHVSGGGGSVLGASQQFAILKLYLEQPRRRLVYSTMTTGSPVAGDANIGTPHFIIEPASEDLYSAGPVAVNMLVKNDVKAGPIPSNVSVTHVANNQVWRVEFTVTFHTVAPCIPAASGHEPTVTGESLNPVDNLNDQINVTLPTTFNGTQRQFGILSNRWSCHDQIDENSYTTRTYTGNVTLANPNWNPNDFRAITIPPITPGMQRRAIDYVTSEDNLSLRYTVVDHEVTVTAPSPARTMKIVHNEAVIDFGAKAQFSLRVYLTGERDTKLYELMRLASAIAEQRLLITEAAVLGTERSIIVDRREFTTEQGTDNTHSLMLVISGSRFSKANNDVPFGISLPGQVSRSVTWRPVGGGPGPMFNYNNVLSKGNRLFEDPATEGSIPAISCLHAKLTSPCSQEFSVEASTPESTEVTNRLARVAALEASTTNYSSRDLYGSYPTSINIEINDNLADAATNLNYTTAHQQNMYSHYNISSTYSGEGVKVALPVAQTADTPVSNNVMVSIGPRQYTRKIRIEAERIGAPPRLPEPVESFTEATYGAVSASEDLTNTLLTSVVTHLNPSPVADGISLIYTAYLDMTYSQNRRPAKFRYGFPDYIKPTTYGSGVPATDRASGNHITDQAFYRNELMDVFASEKSLSSW